MFVTISIAARGKEEPDLVDLSFRSQIDCQSAADEPGDWNSRNRCGLDYNWIGRNKRPVKGKGGPSIWRETLRRLSSKLADHISDGPA